MKIAIFGESSTDDAVIEILAQAIIGEEIEFISAPRLEIRDTKRGGSANMYKHLRNFFRYWYYSTEAEYLIMIIDSDDTPIHQIEHEEEGKENEKCRLCALRQNIKKSNRRYRLLKIESKSKRQLV